MDIKIDHVSPVRRRLHFTVPSSAVAGAFQAVTQKLANKVRIPGFRPGKAPASMIERMYGAEVRREVLDKVLGTWVFTAINSASVRAVGRPEVEAFGDLRRDADLPVTILVEVVPEIELTGYSGAELTADVVQADAEDIDTALKARQETRAEWVPVETGAQDGDEVVVDYTLTEVGTDAAPKSASKRRLKLGADWGVPKVLTDALTGCKPGDRIEKTVTAGEGDDGYEAGQEIKVEAQVHEVQRKDVPALDDELAKDLGFDDLAAMHAAIEAELKSEADKRSTELRRRAAVDHLLQVNPFEVPPSLVDGYVDEQLSRMLGGMTRQQARGLEDLLNRLRSSLVADAEVALRRSLALEALVKQENIEVSEADIAAEVARLIEEAPANRKELTRQQLSHADAQDDVRRRLANERALDRLIELGQVQVDQTKALREARTDEGQRATPPPAAATPAPHVHGPDCDHDHDDEHEGHDHSHAAV